MISDWDVVFWWTLAGLVSLLSKSIENRFKKRFKEVTGIDFNEAVRRRKRD